MINELKERVACSRLYVSKAVGSSGLYHLFATVIILSVSEFPSQIRIRVLTLLREGDAFVRGTSSVYTHACPACRIVME